MIFRIVFFFLTISGLLNADVYPKTFARLGTPLYKSVEQTSAFLSIQTLKVEIEKFDKEAKNTRIHGENVDISKNKKDIKKYLLELRKLQKNYDYLLHLIHKEIEKSIVDKDYDKFIKLTSYELDGLLENRNIKNNAMKFYENNRQNKKSKILEKEIENRELIQATTQEFYNEILNSSYNSQSSNKQSKNSVSIYTKRVKNRIEVFLKNSNPYDVTVYIKAKYKNISTLSKPTKEFVIKANSTQIYTTLIIGKGKTSYSYKYSWIIGNKNAVHDDTYLYRFPYAKGTSHMISQGYNGKYTHKGNSKYSIDFVMNEGTDIYASRAGVVIKTKSDSNTGGYDKKFAKDGNYITILHSDGTFATYYHLKQHGVLVHVGDKVERGSKIGYSGNTGYSSGPHLHFAVFSAVSAKATHTIKVRFVDKNGIVEIPIQGNNYIAK